MDQELHADFENLITSVVTPKQSGEMGLFSNNNENGFLKPFDNFGQWSYQRLALPGLETIEMLSYKVSTFHPFIVSGDVRRFLTGVLATHRLPRSKMAILGIFLNFLIKSSKMEVSEYQLLHCWMQNLDS